MTRRKAGRPIIRKPGIKIISTELTQEQVTFLESIGNKSLSATLRQLVQERMDAGNCLGVWNETSVGIKHT